MTYILYTIIEIIYYAFIALVIGFFNHSSMTISSLILMLFSLLLSTITFLLIHFVKDRKKFFIISSFFIILLCSVFHVFGENILSIFNIKTGIINFTMYLYKILFMFSPFLILYFLGIHKLIYNNKKKQSYLIITSRRFLAIVFILIAINIFQFSTILYILTIIELIFNFIPLYNKN